MSKNIISVIDIPYPDTPDMHPVVRGKALGDYTMEFFHDYSSTYGADLNVIRNFDDDEGRFPNHPVWAMIKIIFDFADSRYDKLMYCDSDIILTPLSCIQHGGNIFDRGPGFWAEKDSGINYKNEELGRWAKKNYGVDIASKKEGSGIVLPDEHYFNAGMVSMDKKTANELCQKMTNMPFLDGPFFREQDYLNVVVDQCSFDVSWLSEGWSLYNWMSVENFGDTIGKFFVHFVGEHKSTMPEFAKFFRAQKALFKTQ